MARLQAYHWPGNVRELQSVLKQALLRASGPVLLARFLPELVDGMDESQTGPANPELEGFIRKRLGDKGGDLHAEVHEYVDRLLLARVLEHEGNQLQAARRLGIARETLRRRLRELGLRVTQGVLPAETNRA
jgi:two-component system nitrogen regulation response regulator GlnG